MAINLENYTRTFFQSHPDRNIPDILKELKITPQKYPRLLDIFSGEGTVVKYLSDLGWHHNTAIDIAPPPAIPSHIQTYLQADLFEFAHQLGCHPETISRSPLFPYKNKFDLITCYSPIATNSDYSVRILTHNEFVLLAKFFGKTSAFYVSDTPDRKFGHVSQLVSSTH